MDDRYQKDYAKAYSEDSFWTKLMKFAKMAGIKVTYAALLLFYVLQNPSTPKWVKGSIIGSLGYFISPLDAIPDILPILGYSDDLGVLVLALATATIYINSDIKERARQKLRDWFGDFNEDDLVEIEAKIKK